ncbi:Ig-like domain-containing protein [Desulforhabdus sp. TSK]|uniref:Ig-like domain-containing protein n=1 Tax=Desulforhabdus sp. TSK TaxID=2925014 RepID=UPI001FC801CF|nr:Ig-like domain-containing protein [Desulforhabdus sp. TSK]GKT10977.1 hypothetical protein DSTSK_42820 [Desulforhabdus sp. TSK]
MTRKGRNLFAVLLGALLLGVFAAPSVWAHAIDYTAYDIQPQADFDGQSGHFRLIKPIAPGGLIFFRLTLELIESAGGGTSLLPATITFGVKNSVPGDLLVRFGQGIDLASVSALPATIAQTYVKQNGLIASLQTAVSAIAPTAPGSYFFKIQAINGFKGNGLQPGEGIVIHFKVAEPEVTLPVETVLDVKLASPSILYRAPSNTITATLTEKLSGTPVPGQPINFYFEGGELASSVTTDANGIATYDYTTSGLNVGDYTVAANFAGTVAYLQSSGSTTQCVTFKFLSNSRL